MATDRWITCPPPHSSSESFLPALWKSPGPRRAAPRGGWEEGEEGTTPGGEREAGGGAPEVPTRVGHGDTSGVTRMEQARPSPRRDPTFRAPEPPSAEGAIAWTTEPKASPSPSVKITRMLPEPVGCCPELRECFGEDAREEGFGASGPDGRQAGPGG